MEQSDLKRARQYIKERNWKGAVESFSLYMKEEPGPHPAEVYASYARTLRLTGHTASASKILTEGKDHHPESERIFVEHHRLCDFLGEWEAARRIAKRLIQLQPGKADYHFLLGRSESFLSNYAKAKKSYRQALSLKHGTAFDEILLKVQQGFAEEPSEVRSRYIFTDGKNNLGAFVHRYRGRKYFTKIAAYTDARHGAGRETGFYKTLADEFPSLKNIIPGYRHSLIIDDISYLTIELIDADNGAQPDLAGVVQASRGITAVRYSDLAEKYPLPGYAYQFRKGRAISVVHFFTQIHQESYNRKLFDALKLIMDQHSYPSGIRKLIRRLETAVMDHQLYLQIDPAAHYSLLHGDFAFQNLLVEKSTQSVRAIDWSSYTIGPHFIDLARYFTSLPLPYKEIKSAYLDADETGLSAIEEIFFLYALIVFYFQKLGRKGIESELSDFIFPAVEDLELAVLKYTQKEEGDLLKASEKDELQLKLKQLQLENEILKEERRLLQKRHEETLNSKSWRITAPLRLFAERRSLSD